MFAGRSVRVRWPLFAADYGESFGESRGKFETKGLFENRLESRNRVGRVEVQFVSAGRRVMMIFQLVYAPTPVAPQPTNHRARADDAATAGARSPTTDTLVLSLILLRRSIEHT